MHYIRIRVLFVLNILILILASYGFSQLNAYTLRLLDGDFQNYTKSTMMLVHIARVSLAGCWCVGCFFTVKFLVEMQFTRYINRLDRQIQASESEGWKPFVVLKTSLFPKPHEMDAVIRTLQKAGSSNTDPIRTQILEALEAEDAAKLKTLAHELDSAETHSP